ncbi:MAG: hypothetical protein WD887_00745 [Candidatus Saccharimonadales bacterium]
MRFPKRRDEEPEEAAEPAPFMPPPIETTTEIHNEVNTDAPIEVDEPAASRWLRAAISLIVLILILIGLFLGGRWLYNTIFNDSNTPAPQVSGPGTAPATGQTQAEKDREKNQTSGSPARGDRDGQSPTVASRTPATGGELPNSGPGSVLAIFVGASLAATALHYIVSLRRSA